MGASYHRGTSKQDVETPQDFLDAVERRFGKLTFDVACTRENRKAPDFSTESEPKLWPGNGVLWCNPPYSDMRTWARLCWQWGASGVDGKLLLLCPASISTDWAAEYVVNKCWIYALRPRLTFVGHEDPYPKDLMLCVFGSGVDAGIESWRWREKKDFRRPSPREVTDE